MTKITCPKCGGPQTPFETAPEVTVYTCVECRGPPPDRSPSLLWKAIFVLSFPFLVLVVYVSRPVMRVAGIGRSAIRYLREVRERELTDARIKRRRAIRSAIAMGFSIPPTLIFVLRPSGIQTFGSSWPFTWQVVFVVSLGLSLLFGWEPAKETWFGDQSIYVEEPEVDYDE